uniref:Protein RFT1 homolog n=1 Tax=Amorphochlora amoebiformis TaxID=1561963 RepID=A0A7S0CTJ0_9EUKA
MANNKADLTKLGDMDAVYGVVFNLGSLLGRILFEPIETQSRVQFSKIASHKLTYDSNPSPQRLHEFKSKWSEAASSLSFRLRALLQISGIIVSLGPAYSWLLIHILYQSKYSSTDAPYVLQWYCVYVLLMACNGMLEAFRDAVASPHDLATWLTGLMVGTCVMSSVVAYYIVPEYGSVGIVWANSINLLLRIIFSAYFIVYRGVQPRGVRRGALETLRDSLPHVNVVFCLVVAGITATLASPGNLEGAGLWEHGTHVGIGVVCGVAILATIWFHDITLREEILSVLKTILPSRLTRLWGSRKSS